MGSPEIDRSNTARMPFSIITASYNMLTYLPRCRASVADQEAVDVEHILMDGGSTDGTVEWLRANAAPMEKRDAGFSSGFYFHSGADKGMYDALNKGFDQARGDILAWLNCDEQYLEGTLAYVNEQFAAHPQVDFLFGGALLVDPKGKLIAERRAYPLREAYLETAHLYNLSCAMFFRRRVWENGLRFDTTFRNLGDHDLLLRALKSGKRMRAIPRTLSVFTFTGSNLSWTDGAKQEAAELKAAAPAWMRFFSPLLNVFRLLEKAMHGGYSKRRVHYAVYPENDTSERVRHTVEKAPVNWPEDV